VGDFLRTRREALQPEDVGLPRGQRRRTRGLRREEVAVLCHLSADYYSRLEQARGPVPSEQMVAALAQGLHLSLDERDHLFRLAGHPPPAPGVGTDHVSPGTMRILDRLDDTPAEVVTELGETLRQTRLGVALVGDLTRFTGPERSIGYRWFTLPEARALHPVEDHDHFSRMYVMGLRGPGSRAAQLAASLRQRSGEFEALWQEHQIGIRPHETKRYLHPSLGLLELSCQILQDPTQAHSLLVWTAAPGSESHDKLQLLSSIGVATP